MVSYIFLSRLYTINLCAHRNDALYKPTETTTLPTTTTSTTTSQPPPQQQQQQQQQQPFYQQYQQQQQMPFEGRRAMPPGYGQGRKRRPTYRRRRPVYEYYYVDDYDDQQEYYDDSVEHMPMAKKPIRKHSRFNSKWCCFDYYYYLGRYRLLSVPNLHCFFHYENIPTPLSWAPRDGGFGSYNKLYFIDLYLKVMIYKSNYIQ